MQVTLASIACLLLFVPAVSAIDGPPVVGPPNAPPAPVVDPCSPYTPVVNFALDCAGRNTPDAGTYTTWAGETRGWASDAVDAYLAYGEYASGHTLWAANNLATIVLCNYVYDDTPIFCQ